MRWPLLPFISRRFTRSTVAPLVRVPSVSLGAYYLSEPDKELRQGEIISNITYYVIRPDEGNPGNVKTSYGTVAFSIVATPECDLLQDFKALSSGKTSQLREVLFFELSEPAVVKKQLGWGRDAWKRVETNTIDRFYYLREIEKEVDLIGEGIKHDLVVDFRRYFTLPSTEIYRQFAEAAPAPKKAQRRCRLTELWREDLQRKGMAYMQRVGLPDPTD